MLQRYADLAITKEVVVGASEVGLGIWVKRLIPGLAWFHGHSLHEHGGFGCSGVIREHEGQPWEGGGGGEE